MYIRIARLASMLAFVLFAYAQFQGWNLFDDHADSGRGHSSSGRSYHK